MRENSGIRERWVPFFVGGKEGEKHISVVQFFPASQSHALGVGVLNRNELALRGSSTKLDEISGQTKVRTNGKENVVYLAA